jgi:hypothetical protein
LIVTRTHGTTPIFFGTMMRNRRIDFRKRQGRRLLVSLFLQGL